MAPTYKIHPGIGIARLGDSPDEFYLAPETPASLPIQCDAQGNPRLSPDGMSELRVRKFKDSKGRVKRQAARFQVYVYDEDHPEGRALKLGDPIKGGGNDGVLVDIEWRVWVANKKAVWHEFRQLEGEHGYSPDHKLRNADVTGTDARQHLIIDPGPQLVNATDRTEASLDRHRDSYAPVFPPDLSPRSIDTLGDLKVDAVGRLLVLGGHGHSGSTKTGFGQPRIEDYANNDGWFDDTSDGPVMARLVMYSANVDALRYIDVEYPAWVVTGYPRYVPEVLDMVTSDDVVYDMAIREFAYRPDLFGRPGTFECPDHIDPADTQALLHWKAGALEWNREHRPWFYRDVWPILFRADEFSYLSNALQLSNFPHNQTTRGNFDPHRLGQPPFVHRLALHRQRHLQVDGNHSGDLYVEAVESMLAMFQHRHELPRVAAKAQDPDVHGSAAGQGGSKPGRIRGHLADEVLRFLVGALQKKKVRDAIKEFVRNAPGLSEAYADFEVQGADSAADDYLERWQRAYRKGGPAFEAAKDKLEQTLGSLLKQIEKVLEPDDARPSPDVGEASADGQLIEALRASGQQALDDYLTGKLLSAALLKAEADCTQDPDRPFRQFLYKLLRRPGEENEFRLGGRPGSRVNHLPLMPLLAGDNPISNVLPSKFLRLTEYQLFILKQWADGLFYNEKDEGWVDEVDPFHPYVQFKNTSANDLDRGVLSNLLGGAFCPGGEVGWIQRNPSAFKEPYRLKASPDFYVFRQTAAQANAQSGAVRVSEDYIATGGIQLSQSSNLTVGLEPGDLTAQMALPWQSDFNECSTQTISVTFEEWNRTYPDTPDDPRLQLEERMWETLWWPAHRPLQAWEAVTGPDGKPKLQFLQWARGVPATNVGDLKMVTEWSKLGFLVRNPALTEEELNQPSPDQKYVSVERTQTEE